MPVSAAISTQRADDDARFVLEAIGRVIDSGNVVTAAAAGPNTTYKSIAASLPAHLRGTDGKRRVSSAVQRLQVSGQIGRVAFKRSNRHEGHTWELTQSDSLPVT